MEGKYVIIDLRNMDFMKDKNGIIYYDTEEDVMSVIDGESIISRVYKKCNGKIDTNVLAVIMLYNKHIVDEQYEAADKLKSHILDFY